MSATIGVETASFKAAISRTASLSGTAARMISHPAASSYFAWRTLPSMSWAGVLSMDWMDTGALPPIARFPTRISFEFLRFMLSSGCNAHNVVEGNRHHQQNQKQEAGRVDIALILGV